MNNASAKKLCMDLLHSETEHEVIEVLKRAKLWSDQSLWRLYGDRDNNYSTIGNQQGRPEAALVEKLINCVDARLMNEVLSRGIAPSSDEAPRSIQQAVAVFFEGRDLRGDIGGSIKGWGKAKELEEARKITLAATGSRQSPSLVIADCGEGQTPSRMPETFLSIDKSNKLRIPFVQGKFNMGGTGVLKFCGKESIQLIISKRNPALLDDAEKTEPSSTEWGFTVVRRERPPAGSSGTVRNSVFRYLAPRGADATPCLGGVLSFESATLALMPERNEPLVREIPYGSCIKLYEYDMKGFKSNILIGRDCLKTRLEILLPDPALPIRLYECRDFKGKAGSFETTMLGVLGRLENDRAENLEEGFPSPAPFRVQGENMIANIFAFKADKAESYRTTEGIVFTINGQTHGSIPKTFFSRSAVRMGRLAKSLLVVVDCTQLSVDAREDLFMNSRDRLSSHELRKALETELEELIGKHPGLKALQEKRRHEEINDRLEDSKPLEEVLESILRSSPSLERLFLLGQRLSKAHKSGGPGSQGGHSGSKEGQAKFHGLPHPTYFRFHKHAKGEVLTRETEHGRRCRIRFDTNVENEYFSRAENRGHYYVEVISGAMTGSELDGSLTLHEGVANWSINLPEDVLSIGDEMTVQCTVTDDVIIDPIVNVAHLRIIKQADHNEKGAGKRKTNTSGGNDEDPNGKMGQGGGSGESGPPSQTGISFPPMFKVKEGDELWKKYHFDEFTACKLIEDADEASGQSVYSFYVNVDHIALRNDMKRSTEDAILQEAKFFYGNVLLGLALIHQQKSDEKRQIGRDYPKDPRPIEDIVEATTRASAPFLVPMIDYLGALTPDEAAGIAQLGDED
jgi:hypothetical protein